MHQTITFRISFFILNPIRFYIKFAQYAQFEFNIFEMQTKFNRGRKIWHGYGKLESK